MEEERKEGMEEGRNEEMEAWRNSRISGVWPEVSETITVIVTFAMYALDGEAAPLRAQSLPKASKSLSGAS